MQTLGGIMKHWRIWLLGAAVMLAGCGTMGGAMEGAGQDLQRAGEWLRNK